MISQEELKALEVINRTKKANTFDSSLDIISMLDSVNLTEHELRDILTISHKYQYPGNAADLKAFEKAFMELNDLPYKRVLWLKKVPQEYKKICAQVYYTPHVFEFDLNELIQQEEKTNPVDLLDLFHISKSVVEKHDYESDELFL